jgi:N-acetyl-anhydromuramyl-L-alanine amidase AmpD
MKIKMSEQKRLDAVTVLLRERPMEPKNMAKFKEAAKQQKALIQGFQTLNQLRILHIFFSEHWSKDTTYDFTEEQTEWLTALCKLCDVQRYDSGKGVDE